MGRPAPRLRPGMLGTGMPGPIDGSETRGISFLSWTAPAPKARPFVPSRGKGGRVFGPEDPEHAFALLIDETTSDCDKIAILATRDLISSRSARSPVCSMTATIFFVPCYASASASAPRGELPKPKPPLPRPTIRDIGFTAHPRRAGRRHPRRPQPEFSALLCRNFDLPRGDDDPRALEWPIGQFLTFVSDSSGVRNSVGGHMISNDHDISPRPAA